MLNKSMITNLVALLLLLGGYFLKQALVLHIGLFAWAGALTNWIAIHMLFEKVPGFYGSGVIPARFEEFKAGIRHLMMTQFFTDENIDRFLGGGNGPRPDLHLAPVIEKVDLSPAFDAFVTVIKESSFGGMLGFVGGEAALKPLKTPFVKTMKKSLIRMTQDDAFIENLREELEQPDVMADIKRQIEEIIEKRLDELTPQIVKEIIQEMIKTHLGWLVVWGGVFGGLIGLIAALLKV